MPTSTWIGLNTALRGLLAQQRALDVSGHNIANANTVGYSRQQADLVASPSLHEPGVGDLGTGVDVQGYSRIRADYLDVQYRAETMKQGYADAMQEGLARVEQTLDEPSDTGLNTLLGKYWSAWQDVANQPESIAARQAVAQSAATLADAFRSLSGELDSIASQSDSQAKGTVDQINQLGTQIGTLSKAIIDAVADHSQPNDLLDQRDVLIDKLASLVNISVTEGNDGGVTITAGGASTPLVAADGSVPATPLTESDFTSLTSGKLKGLVDLRDTTIPSYRDQLDTIASALITQTNTLHAAGKVLNGNPGGAFFVGTDAATMEVAPGIVAAPATIGASASGAPGDPSQALALANVRTMPLIAGTTIDDAYTSFVTQIGSESQQAQSASDLAQARTDLIDSRRQSVSGVSLDEEMTNLMRFQRGFQASSRTMSTIDEMLDTLINRTGRVGL